LARIVPLLSVALILRPSLLRVKRVQSRRAATSSGHKRWVRTARSGSRTDRLISPGSRARLRGDRAWRDLLAQHHGLVRRELGRYRGKERDTAGDGFFATFDGPARAIRAAQAIVSGVNELGLESRIGIHVGECELHEGKVTGLAVNIGARVAATAGANEVLVSQTVRDLVAGSGLTFDDRGSHELKGIPGTWQLFAASY